VSRQLAGAVVWGGWRSCTSATTRGQRALLRSFSSIRLTKKKTRGAQAVRAWPGKGLAGVAELRRLFPGGQEEQAKHAFAFRRELIGVQTTECTT
jgi:hypothetical protein